MRGQKDLKSMKNRSIGLKINENFFSAERGGQSDCV